jgi:hypothetical protein
MHSKSPNPFADQSIHPANPYAPPSIPQPMEMAPTTYQGGVWRQGSILVMHKMAPLPPICLKSGQPANQWLKQNMSWHHPLCYLGLLGGVIPFVIVALIFTKRANIQIGLTDEWMARRKSWIMIGWGTGLLGLALFAGGIVLAVQGFENFPVVGIVVGLITAITGFLIGNFGGTLVSPKKIDDNYVWLKGVNREVLAMFPELPR